MNAFLDPHLGSLETREDLSQDEVDQNYHRSDGTYANDSMYYNLYQLRQDAMTGATSGDSDPKNYNLTGDQLMTCRHLVRGYSLKLKSWSKFGPTPGQLM